MAGLDTASAHSEHGHPPFADASERFLNRELSWLDFNARVLALAEDDRLPLLERAKFLAIFSQNLDEFFEVRVSGLMEQFDAGLRTTTADGLDLVDQLRSIRVRVDELVARSAAVFAKEVVPALDDARHPLRRLGRPVGRRPRAPRRDVRRLDLPGAHAARGRPCAPVPLHLQPVAQPRGHRARPVER